MSIASTCGTGNLSKLQEFVNIAFNKNHHSGTGAIARIQDRNFTRHHCSHNGLGQKALWMFVEWSHAKNYDNSI